jgi:DNA processing protein
MIMQDERIYWVGFNLIKGIGTVRTRKLIDFFGHLSIAWGAPAEALKQAGLPEKSIEMLIQKRKLVDLNAVWDSINKKGIKILTWLDEAYPKRLQEIDQPPPVIYYRGSILPQDEWAVSIVGTRRVTVYGRQITQDTALYLAGNGITIVSGLARGVDAIAHQAALDANGRTFAVLGSGVDIIYPPEHRKLADAILEHGALISDYSPGTQPDGVNFPPRNRIIAGLSRATIVIEAGETSGALITAKFSAEQGRDVFAVPGSILSPMSKGTNNLIQNGAFPMTNPQSVLEVLNYSQVTEHQTARQELPSDPLEARILKALGYEPIHVDELAAQLGLPIAEITAALTMMELKGMVHQTGSMQYLVVREPQNPYH